MDKLDNFKEFIGKNPNLNKYVENKEKTWQDFYEMYDMYGEKEEIWSKYKEVKEETSNQRTSNKTNLNDVVNMVKNIDTTKVQTGINSLQKLLALAGDFFGSKDTSSTSTYNPRPIYKRFED